MNLIWSYRNLTYSPITLALSFFCVCMDGFRHKDRPASPIAWFSLLQRLENGVLVGFSNNTWGNHRDNRECLLNLWVPETMLISERSPCSLDPLDPGVRQVVLLGGLDPLMICWEKNRSLVKIGWRSPWPSIAFLWDQVPSGNLT